jgi:hypothetical protein
VSDGYKRLWASFLVAALVGLAWHTSDPLAVAFVVFVPLWGLLGLAHWLLERRRPPRWQRVKEVSRGAK